MNKILLALTILLCLMATGCESDDNKNHYPDQPEDESQDWDKVKWNDFNWN